VHKQLRFKIVFLFLVSPSTFLKLIAPSPPSSEIQYNTPKQGHLGGVRGEGRGRGV